MDNKSTLETANNAQNCLMKLYMEVNDLKENCPDDIVISELFDDTNRFKDTFITQFKLSAERINNYINNNNFAFELFSYPAEDDACKFILDSASAQLKTPIQQILWPHCSKKLQSSFNIETCFVLMHAMAEYFKRNLDSLKQHTGGFNKVIAQEIKHNSLLTQEFINTIKSKYLSANEGNLKLNIKKQHGG